MLFRQEVTAALLHCRASVVYSMSVGHLLVCVCAVYTVRLSLLLCKCCVERLAVLCFRFCLLPPLLTVVGGGGSASNPAGEGREGNGSQREDAA